MFDYRDYQILSLMLEKKPIHLNDMLDHLMVSKRVFYYALSKINQFLILEGLKPIEKQKDFYQINDELSYAFIDTFLNHNFYEHYICSQEERLYISVLLITSQQKAFKISDFMDHFSISKNSVINDLNEMRNYLSNFYASLDASPTLGYVINGPILRIREIIVDALSNLMDRPFIIDALGVDKAQLNKVKTQLSLLENHFKMPLSETMKTHLSHVLGYFVKYDVTPIPPDLALNRTLNEPLFNEASKLLSKELKQERAFVFLHFIDIKNPMNYPIDKDYLNSLSQAYIDTFKQVTSITFKDEQTLYKGLRLHLNQSLLRYKYAVKIENTLKTNFIKQYNALFQMTKRVTRFLEDQIAYKVSDDDIVYIAMHFGGHLRRENKVIQLKKVLLICDGSMHECENLKDKILSSLDFIEIIAVGSKALLDQSLTYNAVITTQSLYEYPIDAPVYKINKTFTEIDKTYLYHALMVKEEPVSPNKIMNTIKPFIQEKDLSTVKSLIHQLYQQQVPKTLSTFLTHDYIQYLSIPLTLKTAIDLVSLPLLKNVIITQEYSKQSYKNLLDNPRQMHVLEDVLIVHARPSEGVKDNGMSYLNMQNSIHELGIDIKHIFMIAGKDNENHLELLSLLGDFLDTNYESFIALDSKKALLHFMKINDL
ncbi:MAG: BglG family transcription antiterminator [Candidatus Izemoplasmataceae bacterium]